MSEQEKPSDDLVYSTDLSLDLSEKILATIGNLCIRGMSNTTSPSGIYWTGQSDPRNEIMETIRCWLQVNHKRIKDMADGDG